MESQPDHLREELQKDLDKTFAQKGCPYKKVAVLILYWKEDDFELSCAEEARKVVDLFRNDFRYPTEILEIPSEDSQNFLEFKMAEYRFKNDTNSSLLIVYYSGHGDRDPKFGKAVWMAKGVGGPVVDWYLIQPTLMRAQADVFLVFDCCFASSAAKGREEGGIELLAASPSGGYTPKPGKNSFTQYFVEEARRLLRENSQVRTSELPNAIIQHSKQDPVYIPIRPSSGTGILLRPMSEPLGLEPARNYPGEKPLGAFSFTVLVREPPSRDSMRKLGDWIKFSAPPNISRVRINQVINLSSGLQEFLLGQGKAELKGRLIDTFPRKDREVVLSEINDIGEIVAMHQTMSDSSLVDEPKDYKLSPTNIPQSATGFLAAWESRAQKLSHTLWTLMGSHPQYQTASELEALEKNLVARQAGISDAASLQCLAKSLSPQLEAEPRFWAPSEMLPDRLVKDQDVYTTANKGKFVVEIMRPDLSDEHPPLSCRKTQLKNIISLLASRKPDYFHVCCCVGFTAEREDGSGWYGLAFELPVSLKNVSTLMSDFVRFKRVPLEVRYRIAHGIALAIAGLHSIGWVHKGITSNDILFLRSAEDPEEARWNEVRLFGFESSRENAQKTDKKPDFRAEKLIYLPPPRWGSPQEKFSFKHDIYALGVVLLEIGFWSPIASIDKQKQIPKMKKPQDAQKFLKEKAGGADLSHLMGSVYSDIVMYCLGGSSENEESHSLDFSINVVEVLERLAENLKTQN